MNFGILEIIIILLVLSLTVTSLFHYLRLPVIIGYILVGIVIGPNALSIIKSSKEVSTIAEFGIVFLMFTIGLEFSFPKLKLLKKRVFAFGGSQMLLSTLFTALVGYLLGMTLAEILIIAGIISLSSTAITLKQLSEQGEINQEHGLNSVGILLFQDLAVIPLLIMIPTLTDINIYSLTTKLSWALGKGVIAIFIIALIGRWLMRPLFYIIGSGRSLERLTLMSLLVTLGASWVTHEFGLSLALGAFLAGMMLAETEYRHQIENDIRPFKDILLGFFFISVGMLLNLSIFAEAWQWIILLLAAMIFFKVVLITMICLGFKQEIVPSLRTGISLAQGSEFGFALLSLAMVYNLLPQDYAQVILAALLLSMALAPILINNNGSLAKRLLPKQSARQTKKFQPHIDEISSKLDQHVILCGYGRVGQNIARFLQKAEQPFIALDLDSTRTKQAMIAGDPVCYADASSVSMLSHAGINRAKAIVVSFSDMHVALKIIDQVRDIDSTIPLIVRAHDDDDASIFYQRGATEVIPEIFETSLVISSQVLMALKVKQQDILGWINESRHNRYDLLRKIFPGDSAFDEDSAATARVKLLSFEVIKECYAIGKSIGEIPLPRGVQINTICRHGENIESPTSDFIIEQNDVIVLYGPQAELEHAEKVILVGP